MHSYNLFITCISYKRFESIWQCKPLYMQERPNFKLLFALYVFPSISSFAKTVNTRRYTLSFAVWHISWNLYAVNKLLFVTTLFPDYLVINWYMYAVRNIRNVEALATKAKISRTRKQFSTYICLLLYLNYTTRTSTWFYTMSWSLLPNLTVLKFRCVELNNSYCFVW